MWYKYAFLLSLSFFLSLKNLFIFHLFLVSIQDLYKNPLMNWPGNFFRCQYLLQQDTGWIWLWDQYWTTQITKYWQTNTGTQEWGCEPGCETRFSGYQVVQHLGSSTHTRGNRSPAATSWIMSHNHHRRRNQGVKGKPSHIWHYSGRIVHPKTCFMPKFCSKTDSIWGLCSLDPHKNHLYRPQSCRSSYAYECYQKRFSKHSFPPSFYVWREMGEENTVVLSRYIREQYIDVVRPLTVDF